MNIKDEELQKMIEQNSIVKSGRDSDAYKIVFKALANDPYEVPAKFADRVMEKIESRKKSLSGDYFWLASGVVLLIGVACFTAFFVSFSLDFGAFKFISGYGGALTFMCVLFILFHVLDKVVVRKKLQAPFNPSF